MSKKVVYLFIYLFIYLFYNKLSINGYAVAKVASKIWGTCLLCTV